MHTAEYQYQLGQTVYSVDFEAQELRTVTILQVIIEIFGASIGMETLVSYIVALETGVDCSENIQIDESQLFATQEEAADALEAYMGSH